MENNIHPDVKAYWMRQAEMHEKKAKAFSEKYAKTGEIKWLKQAHTNAQHAAGIRYNYDK